MKLCPFLRDMCRKNECEFWTTETAIGRCALKVLCEMTWATRGMNFRKPKIPESP